MTINQIQQGAARGAMLCIPLVACDMYTGLQQWLPELSDEAFMRAVILYHEVKHGLSKESMDQPGVDAHTFFVLKKCIFHWVKGISLALRCAGVPTADAEKLVAQGCREYLRHPMTPPPQIRLHYDWVISPAIRQQYAQPGQIPSNEWCAWLELEAAKLFASQLQIKETEL